jgi:hypothetical protein
MRKEKTLIDLLRRFVEIIDNEAAHNPEFAGKLEALLLPNARPPKNVNPVMRTKVVAELPDIYAEWGARGEQEFRLWLRSVPLAVMRAVIKQHELDPSRRTLRWKEAEKVSEYIADQLQVRLSRGSKFMRS